MKVRLDRLLRECVHDTFATTRRTHSQNNVKRTDVIVRMLYDLEAIGYAMRYRAPRGGIAWKAAPRLLSLLADAEADALADLQHEREALGTYSDCSRVSSRRHGA
jgi:hypothetical protein